MMSELSSLIARECANANKVKYYTFSHKDLYNGAVFKLKPISTKQYYYLIDLCTRDGVVDQNKLQAEILCECIVDPDLRDETFLNSVGTLSPEDTIAKVFPMPGVVRLIRDKIELISGWFDPDEISFQECKGSDSQAS